MPSSVTDCNLIVNYIGGNEVPCTIDGPLTIADDATVSGTLGVTGLSTLGTLTAVGTASINATGSAATTIGSATSNTTVGGAATITGAVTLSNKITTYDGVATVADGISSIVAIRLGDGQTAALGSSLVYAVPASGVGFYRLSSFVTIFVAATTGAATSTLGPVSCISVDDNTVTKTEVGTSSTANTTGTNISNTFVFYAKASTNINVTIGYASNTASEMSYRYKIVLESLGVVA